MKNIKVHQFFKLRDQFETLKN